MASNNHSIAIPPVGQCPLRSVKPEHQLHQAREDAALLLAYAVRSDRSIGAEKTQALIDAIEALDAAGQAGTPQQRSAFWKAYDAIAAAMAPVSAFSIRQTHAQLTRKWWAKPFAPTTAFAIVVFLLSLFAQYLWVTGRDLLDQAGELSKQKVQAVEELWKLRDEQKRIAAERAQLQDRDPPAVPALQATSVVAPSSHSPAARPTGPALEDMRDGARHRAKLELLGEAELRNQSAMPRVERQVDALMKAMADLEPALSNWYRLCPRLLCERDWLDSHDQSRKDSERVAAQLAGPPGPPAEGSANAKLMAADRHSAQPAPALERESRELIKEHAEHSCDLMHRARMLLRALDAYLIPMLMGLLGALTFMLRTLVVQLRNDTYTPALASNSFIRMVLGMVAGALGGMFMPAADTSLKALPPMALPFVFGYGVEILFSVLDRIVNAFTTATAAKA